MTSSRMTSPSFGASVGGPGHLPSTLSPAHVPAYGPPDPEALLSALVDHLLPECPLLQRTCRGREPRLLQGIVDPLGTDICGWCRRVWLARNREKT
jgi:hypothetical protein